MLDFSKFVQVNQEIDRKVQEDLSDLIKTPNTEDIRQQVRQRLNQMLAAPVPGEHIHLFDVDVYADVEDPTRVNWCPKTLFALLRVYGHPQPLHVVEAGTVREVLPNGYTDTFTATDGMFHKYRLRCLDGRFTSEVEFWEPVKHIQVTIDLPEVAPIG